MTSFAWLRARPKALASAGIVSATAVALTTMAFVYEGFPTTEVDLHDGGVWVTKQSALMVGHFNHESRVLDGALRTTSDDYDIVQSGETVLVHNRTDASLTTIDPALVVLTDAADLPADADVQLGGGTIAVLDRESGDAWVLPAAAAGAFEVQGTDPTMSLGRGAAIAVGTDGTAYGVSPSDGELLTIELDEGDEAREPSRTSLEGVDETSEVSVSAVGSTAVVLDAASGRVLSSAGLSAEVEQGQTGVLQVPSAESDAVLVATSGSLVRVPLDGSEPVGVSSGAQGDPAAPVRLNGCSYAAWSGSAKFVRDCVGEADDLSADIEGVTPESVLRFRVNRDVVVLNDIVGGAAWMASDSLQRIDNWNDVTPPEGETEEDEQTTEESVETTLPERTEQNTAPIANDDDFGVRPGRTTVLPVLDNDSDADGDVLTVTLPDGDPGLGVVQPVNNGAGLQIAVPENASGSDSFVYEVDDGRGGTDQATVRMSVRGWDVNSAPVQKRVTAVTVESGGTVSYNVLPDWIDPDGDDVFLASVVPAPGDEADFTSDGRITYRAIGGTQGRKDVVILVSDGNEVTEGVVRFDVRPVGSTVPVTNADHVVVRAGQTVTVSPLANDTSSGREPLRLTRVDEVAGATIVPDFANKTFSFTSDAPGTYYVQYLASAGANGVPGLVRVDVLADSDTDRDPIAVRDVALLPSGGDVLVNVLANDSDPAGGILVVQSVTVEPNSGIAVSVLNHETLRITDQGALSQQVRISYRISNGSRQAEGEVIVIPVPAPSQLRPPVANDDQVIVRAGDIVTIPVLDNDYHPNGDTIHVAPDLVPPLIEPEDGEIFVSEDTLRFKAGDEPGTVYATYEVYDTAGQKDAGYVTIQILPINEETNTAPRPRDLTARVLNGSRVKIAIPLDGIDPDGDSVELVGIATPPKKGRISETGANFLVYEAFDDAAGLDTFSYRVRDRFGKEATAPVRVGIAPAEAVNQAPYAVKDSVIMRPGRSVAVPVTANDSDPDGDEFGLVRDGLVLPDVPGLEAVVQGQRVVVTSPDEPVETSLQYTIRDARGAEAKAVLQITVADDVPLQRPIARDDRVQPADIEDDQVDVEVLANDEDPDGTKDALTVSVAGDTARVLDDGRIRVTLIDAQQLLTYTITDEDGLTASAFLFVPGLTTIPPTLISDRTIEVASGETIDVPLAEYVRAGAGKSVVVTEAAKVQSSFSNGASLVKDQTTLTYTSADGYFGPDALTFEVTDGTGPDDPAGIKATLTIPITVLPPDNQQPTFTNGQVDVAPGEDPASLDLLALTTDPDPGDLDGMSFAIVGGVAQGLSASIEGGTLRASAAANTPKGTTATVTVRVSDGETEPVEGVVTLRVIGSTRPLATANDDVVPEAPQGRTVDVAVLANDFNPFPETPLKIVTARVETGQGAVDIAGDRLSITPGADFFGTLVVRYRVQDATGDPDREVEGRVNVTVQGRPDAPGTPTVSSVQDRTVVLSWSPPPNNGAEITGYTVRSLAGGYSKACVATTCTLDGLTNNVEYNFVVVATNRAGDSEASAPSETARPDARPDTPNPPTLQFGDRSLQVAWVTPSTPGSPVESFTLEISPAPPSGITQKTNVTGNSLTWEGLENGTNYQVRVRAHNRAPDPSSWSAYSAGMVPAAPPSAAAAPTTTRIDSVGTQAQMQVNWTPPAANGDAISGYRLNVIQGGTVRNTIPVAAGQTSQAVTVQTSTSDYTFTVAAQNKAGWGADSAPSAPRRAFTPPGAPTNVSATEGNNTVAVTYTPGAANGANANEIRYEYSVNGGGWRNDWDGRTIGNGQVNNNGSYSVRVRAVATADGSTYQSDPSAASNTVAPYGPIGNPTADASRNDRTITFSWTSPARNGRDITTQIRIDGGGWTTVAARDTIRRDYGYSETHTIEVRTTAAGQTTTASAQARTVDAPPPPQPKAWVTRGGSAVGQPNCGSAACAFFVVNTQNFPAGDYQVTCYSSRSGAFATTRVTSIPANGSRELGCYYGYAGDQVWVGISGTQYERRSW
ncbi:Ig-like domain-containing protein [Microbacterium sp. SLBN-146]|uniref:Ig-like domain-containing protein n=1 Tax=Microbacterium sp. SLBN-146 TaxID=2768457 RepID=UPI001153F688|nr:Ig-like domain-containing protein [Microbacterium sp. SLBN-146]TQJ30562.1 fibronectin type III domain protein [Microbacterium sp. SLBN-146]